MNKQQAMEHLRELKGCFEEFTFVETKEEDIEALNIAIECLRRETAPEVPVQEQPLVNINKLRIKNNLKPIPNGNYDIIAIKQSCKKYSD